MRVSSIRKIWISLFSVVAMLMSSFVSSAPVMTFQDISHSCGGASYTHQMTSNAHRDHRQSVSMQSKQYNNHIGHKCCDCGSCGHGSFYAQAFALFTFIEQPSQMASHLALISSESSGNAIYREASLYRPPIA